MSRKKSNTEEQKNELKKFTDKVYATLMKPNRWYTGTPIKLWIRQNYFLNGAGLNLNYNLQTNRWSAYCHFKADIAFTNIISKLNLAPGSNVIVHPLLQSDLFEIILQNQLNPVLVEIDKTTLELDLEGFNAAISNLKIEAVFLQNINGLNRNNLTILETCHQNQIEIVYYSNETEITTETLKAITHSGATAVIFKTNSWLPKIVNKLTPNIQIEEEPYWYISWFLENRIISSNESHLTQSQDNFQTFLEKIYFLEMEKLKKLDFTSNLFSIFANYAIYKQRLDKLKPIEIEQQVIEDWRVIQQYAIPDLAFDLDEANEYPHQNNDERLNRVVDQVSIRQGNTKKMYNYFLKQIKSQPPNSMEIPIYYLDLTYTAYHFFSLNKQEWIDNLNQTGFKCLILTDPHPYIAQKLESLPNTALILNYGVILKVPDYEINL